MSDILGPWGRLRMTRPGRRHRIGKGHIRAAMESAIVVERQIGGAVLFVGDDDRGLELEVVVVPDDRNPGVWAVIHAMPTALRRRP